MLYKTEGIIFKKIKYSETSLILDIFTKESGLQTFIISGVRKANSKANPNSLKETSIIDLVAYKKENNSLSRIKEFKSSIFYQSLGLDIIKSSIAMFILEIARNAIKEKTENLFLYEFLKESFIQLDQEGIRVSNYHINFMLKLSALIGIEIQNNYNSNKTYFHLGEGEFKADYINQFSLDQELSLKVYQLLKCSASEILNLKLDAQSRNQILDALIAFYQFHIDGFGPIKSLTVFRTVLS